LLNLGWKTLFWLKCCERKTLFQLKKEAEQAGYGVSRTGPKFVRRKWGDRGNHVFSSSSGLLRRSYFLDDHLVGHRSGKTMPAKNITKVFNIAEWGRLCCRPLYINNFSLVFVKNHMGQMTPNKSHSSARVNQSQSRSHSRNHAKWALSFFFLKIYLLLQVQTNTLSK